MNLSLTPESALKCCSLCVLARGLAELVAVLAAGGETGTQAEAGRLGQQGQSSRLSADLVVTLRRV